MLVSLLFFSCQKEEEECSFSFSEKINFSKLKELTSRKDCSSLLRNIKKIDLSNQKIKNADFLSKFKNIEFLNLSNNLIKDISFIGNLKKIIYLNIRNNLVSEINILKNNKKLKFVLLEGNPIKGELNYCPTDFKLNYLNKFCKKLTSIDRFNSTLSKSYDSSCSLEKPINLLMKKKMV